MTTAGAILLAVVCWLAWRGRPLVPRDRAVYLSEKWQRDHLYMDGKHGRL